MSINKESLGSLLSAKKRPAKSVGLEVKQEIIGNIAKEQVHEEVIKQAEYKAEVIVQDNGIDPVSELRKLAQGGKKKKLEKERTKCTHWLSDEEIKMLAKLSKETGKPKYEILGTSIKYMYSLVMEKDEKGTS